MLGGGRSVPEEPRPPSFKKFLLRVTQARDASVTEKTTLREKLIKIGVKVMRHSRKIVFQMAEVAVPRELFQTMLGRIGRLKLATAMTG
jgi:hypothetical protein